MARTLPWTIEHGTSAKKARLTPGPRLKQEELSSPIRNDRSDDEVTLSSRGRAVNANAAAASGRGFLTYICSKTQPNIFTGMTPSSSPVRGPPPIE